MKYRSIGGKIAGLCVKDTGVDRHRRRVHPLARAPRGFTVPPARIRRVGAPHMLACWSACIGAGRMRAVGLVTRGRRAVCRAGGLVRQGRRSGRGVGVRRWRARL
jgi:hypothetical protein